MSQDLNLILEQFMLEKPKRRVFGNYRIIDNTLVYRASRSEDAWRLSKEGLEKRLSEGQQLVPNVRDPDGTASCPSKLVFFEQNEIARKITNNGQTTFLGNASILPLIGRKMHYGRESLNSSETKIQRLMTLKGFVMIPFNVMEEAKLDLNSFKSIDKGPEETIAIKTRIDHPRSSELTFQIRDRHFVGAHLFEIGGTNFLFDIDRRELQHKIFNPFLVKLTKKAKTIKEAYETLKPKKVVVAERKGLKVLRQGEWFFIPCKGPKLKKLSQTDTIKALQTSRWSGELQKLLGLKKLSQKEEKSLLDKIPRPRELRAGQNRPNKVEWCVVQNKTTFVRGKVIHSGREHANLVLKGWYVAVPNTATSSFTITGDID